MLKRSPNHPPQLMCHPSASKQRASVPQQADEFWKCNFRAIAPAKTLKIQPNLQQPATLGTLFRFGEMQAQRLLRKALQIQPNFQKLCYVAVFISTATWRPLVLITKCDRLKPNCRSFRITKCWRFGQPKKQLMLGSTIAIELLKHQNHSSAPSSPSENSTPIVGTI